MKGNNINFTVAAHYKQLDHSIDNVRYVLFASLFKCQQERRRSKFKYILKINSHIRILNSNLDIYPMNTVSTKCHLQTLYTLNRDKQLGPNY